MEGYFGAKDVPGDNHIGAVIHDEELFATDKVTCVGQVCLPYKLPIVAESPRE